MTYKLYLGLKTRSGEPIPVDDARQWVLAHLDLDAYTIYQVMGVWKGTAEDSLIVEVLWDVDASHIRALSRLGREYASRFCQECTLLHLSPGGRSVFLTPLEGPK